MRGIYRNEIGWEVQMISRFSPAIFCGVVLLSLFCQPAAKVEAFGSGFGHDDDETTLPLHEQETIRKSFTVGGAHRLLNVDNVFGSI